LPDPINELSVPPETVISPTTKSLADSESVKVIVAVSPAFKLETLLLKAIVGADIVGAISTIVDTKFTGSL